MLHDRANHRNVAKLGTPHDDAPNAPDAFDKTPTSDSSIPHANACASTLNTILASKNALRVYMRAQRAALSSAEVHKHALTATAFLLSDPVFTAARCVALYVSVRNELSTRALMEALWQRGKTTLIPRCDTVQARHMEFTEVHAWPSLKRTRFGLYEVPPTLPPATQTPDVLLMPAVAVDLQGRRLGQGGGYYDRYIQQTLLWCDVPRLAFVHKMQIVPAVPNTAHDINVHGIAHEEGCVWLSK